MERFRYLNILIYMYRIIIRKYNVYLFEMIRLFYFILIRNYNYHLLKKIINNIDG